MDPTELQPSVQSPVRRLRVWRALLLAVLMGVVAATLHAGLATRETAPPPAPIVQHISVPIHVEVTAPSPPAPPSDDLGCPVIAAKDEPIGAPLDKLPQPDGAYAKLEAVAAARARRIAILDPVEKRVHVSDDDGRTFKRAFAGRAIEQIEIDVDGVLYARTRTSLGVLGPEGSERWHAAPFSACADESCGGDRIAVAGTTLAWFRDSEVATSDNGAKTWTRTALTDYAWTRSSDYAFAWRGAIYEVAHYVERCGIDEHHVWRFDPATRKVAHTIFHNDYDGDAPPLRASDDVGTTWTWRLRDQHDAVTSDMLFAKTLLPVEGARTLAVHEGGAVELCTRGARQIYRSFPYERIDAVDVAGRPIVATHEAVVRWSPQHGWRRVFGLERKSE